MKFRLAYIVTQPIQYQAPMLRLITASGKIKLKVFFLSDFSLYAHHEAAFGKTFKWDVNLTDGYDWEILPRWGIGCSTPLRPWWPVRGIQKRLKAGRFDAVWIHGWGHIGLRQAIKTAYNLGIPVLLRGESMLDQKDTQTLRRRLRNFYCQKLFPRVDGFLCIGSLNRKFYHSFGVSEEKLFRMPYAVDNQRFQTGCLLASSKRREFKMELGLESGRPVILFAAKFIANKAPGDLLAAYQRLWGQDRKSECVNNKSETKKPYLLFVGDGPLRGELEAQAGEMNGSDVRFLGFKNQNELPALYDFCDVFVLPSRIEPWGLVLNEVMNAGKAVIVSDSVGAAPDLVRPGINGWVFPNGDVSALADCLKQAFLSADLSKMGRRSLEFVNNWNYIADLNGLLEALETICEKPQTSDG